MCEINLENSDEYDSHLDLLDDKQQGNYDMAFSHYKTDNPAYHSEYFSNARFIIYANPAFADKYCRCGMKNRINTSGKCACRHYCPKCAWIKYRNVLRPFEHSFLKGKFHFITLSYNGFVNFSKDPYDITMYWDAAKYALTKAEKEKYIRGAMIAFEIHVEQYLPTLVNPHAHAIIDADEITEAVKLQIADWMTEYLIIEIAKENQEEGKMPEPLDEDQLSRMHLPNIRVDPIKDEKEFMGKFQYSLKPIILADAYRSTWINKVVEQPDLAVRLNSELKDFIVGLAHVATNKKRYVKLGNMHRRSKQYIGNVVEIDVDDNNETEEQIAA